MEDPGEPVSPAAGEKSKTSAKLIGTGEDQEPKAGGPTSKDARKRQYDEMLVNASLLKHIKNPYKENLREAIRNCVNLYSRSIRKASLALVYMVKEMYYDVTCIKRDQFPEELFDKTFIRHLMVGTGKRLQ